ncbi:ATP-dependent RNA helicase HrpA [Neomicrococcus lactis]|uniref:ATP-dependent RNA helicase HrpA n=1 Tax=Neomicrococcus lactis TaxID=732241 RepID=UPI0023010D23|nr:ATP-dependent RNA helicase HrpA [Neomicrococcus lactis]
MSMTITYPPTLPVSARREDIKKAISEHQVVIVAGETGSGKTTQLPKMLLELGYGDRGVIGHTQPRRLAARTVAERLAEELDVKIGDEVGYQVRFTGEVSKETKVKLMTDGIMLAEIPQDRKLERYSAIIIDEAHERSLNIDFLMGYLKRLLPQRPDLKIVITSATIDPERFAKHFGSEEKPAPIVEVSGRTFPVEIRYRPLAANEQLEADELDPESVLEEDKDPVDGICDAVVELSKEAPGDILVFLSGEREIRDAADALRGLVERNRRLAGTQILPLFARLSLAEQHQVFNPGPHRRIILATNVAETSLTVPGIKYVIDTGVARISRYSHRTKVQRLPIERVSQASANQRSGRCGRVSDGIAIRLYSEEDFESRPEFTDPEILRTNLASVILSMSAMGIIASPKDVGDFPFVEKPDDKAVNDGVVLLRELGAMGGGSGSGRNSGGITRTGRQLAKLPVDVRLGRMILEAGRRDCAKEVMVLAAALSIQDPRERPSQETGKRERATELHRRFEDENSDFLSLLNLWRYLQEKQQELSSSAFRRLCKQEFINYLRVREWQDLFTQLRQLAKSVGIKIAAAPIDPVAKADNVHMSLLSGLVSHIGLWDERKRDYQGARGGRFSIFPGSALFKKRPDWVMAAELVETSRLWARTNAKFDPAWVEVVAPHLVKKSYSEPHWSSSLGSVMAYEKVTAFGLPVVAQRRIQFRAVNLRLAREMFIQHALVEGDWKTRHAFFARNRKLLEDIEELETRTRRRDLRVSDQDLFDFYDARLGPDVTSERHFDAWWKVAQQDNPKLLDFDPDALRSDEAENIDESAYPRTMQHGELELDLRYEFNPAARDDETDGVTVRVPVLFLNQLNAARFAWQVPGFREELVTALIKSLPKNIRKNFVPAPDVARQATAALNADFDPTVDALEPSLELVLRRLRGVVIPPGSWNWDAIPPHLKPKFEVIGQQNKMLARSEDLKYLQVSLATQNRQAIASSLEPRQSGKVSGNGSSVPAKPGTAVPQKQNARGAQKKAGAPGSAQVTGTWERAGLTSWDENLGDKGTIHQKIESTVAGKTITAFPALVDEGSSVRLAVFRSAAEQQAAHRTGVVRLLQLTIPSPARYVLDHLKNNEKLVFSQNPHGSVEELIRDSSLAAIDSLVPANLPYTRQDFQKLFDAVRAELIDSVFTITALVEKTLSASLRLTKRLNSLTSPAVAASVADVRSQLELLVYPGFVARTGSAQLRHMPRYLAGMETRLEKLASGAAPREAQNIGIVQALEDDYDAALDQLLPNQSTPASLARIKWMIEEFRVSVFAQELGTAHPVSEKRIRTALREALAELKK